MTLPQAVASAFRQYVGFSGRARRSEFWFFTLFEVIAVLLAVGVDAALGFMIAYPVVVLALLLPALAVSVRRLHDTDRSGWWYLLSFVPLAGLVLIVFWCQDSGADNRFGPSPKRAAAPGAPDTVAPVAPA